MQNGIGHGAWTKGWAAIVLASLVLLFALLTVSPVGAVVGDNPGLVIDARPPRSPRVRQ